MKLACFTILHYKAIKETRACVDSLLRLQRIEECQIIILDNGSKDGTFEKLERCYSGDERVCVVGSEENVGFSAGNNMAYQIAQTYAPKFIIILNNDIVIKQKEFLPHLCEVSQAGTYYFIGPDVYAAHTKAHQSPLYAGFPTPEQVDRDMDQYREWKADPKLQAQKERIASTKNWYRRMMPDQLIALYRSIKGLFGFKIKQKEYQQEIEDAVLQGACIIVTEHYISKYDVVFEPDTRFYFEELLLALKCKTLHFKTLYTPRLQVIHNHGAATRSSSASAEEYIIRVAHSMLKAYDVFLSTVKDNPWKKNL